MLRKRGCGLRIAAPFFIPTDHEPILPPSADAARCRSAAVRWSHTVEPLGDSRCRITLRADIPEGYHLYDPGPYDEGVAFATVIDFAPSPDIRLEGALEILDTPVYHTDANGNRIGWFENQARFARTIRLTGSEAQVHIHLEWMICSATSCMLPDECDLELHLNASPTNPCKDTPTTGNPDRK